MTFHKIPLREQLPDQLDRITIKVRIGRDQGKFFLDTLRDQDTVERVAVVHRQRFDPQDVVQSNRQNLDPVLCCLLNKVRTRRLRQRKFARLHFDQYLPNAGALSQRSLGPVNIFCARRESLWSSAIAHKNACVSRSALIRRRDPRSPWGEDR